MLITLHAGTVKIRDLFRKINSSCKLEFPDVKSEDNYSTVNKLKPLHFHTQIFIIKFFQSTIASNTNR